MWTVFSVALDDVTALRGDRGRSGSGEGHPQIVFVDGRNRIWLELSQAREVPIDQAKRRCVFVEPHRNERRCHSLPASRAGDLHDEPGNMPAIGVDDKAEELTELSIVECSDAQPRQGQVVDSRVNGWKKSRIAHGLPLGNLLSKIGTTNNA